MSVINQMLRDLEERKVQASGSNHYVDEVNIVASAKPRLWWIVLSLMLIIILSANVYLHNLNQTTDVSMSETENETEQLLNKTNVANNSGVVSDVQKLEIELSDLSDNLTEQNADENVKETISDNKLQFKAQPSVTIKTIIKSKPIANAETEAPEVKQSSKSIAIPPEDKPTEVPVKPPAKAVIKIEKAKVSSEELIQQARLLMITDQKAAIKKLEDNLNTIMADSDYHALLANLYQRQKRFNEAIVHYKKALTIAPDKGELWIGIALAFEGSGAGKEANAAYERAYHSAEISAALKQYAQQKLNSGQ